MRRQPPDLLVVDEADRLKTASLEQLALFLVGSAMPDAPQYDVLAQALNDSFTGLDLDHPVPYFDELGSP